jgi:hypothetical protein
VAYLKVYITPNISRADYMTSSTTKYDIVALESSNDVQMMVMFSGGHWMRWDGRGRQLQWSGVGRRLAREWGSESGIRFWGSFIYASRYQVMDWMSTMSEYALLCVGVLLVAFFKSVIDYKVCCSVCLG